MAVRREIRLGDRSVTVEVLGDGRLDVDGVGYSASPAGPCLWRIAGPASSARVWVAGPPEAPWAFFDGRAYQLEVEAAGRVRSARTDAHGALSAPMPATVRAVLVSPGDRVSRGDVLIVLEAMKMELPVRAPAGGTVTEVRCAPGELVQPGTALVEIA